MAYNKYFSFLILACSFITLLCPGKISAQDCRAAQINPVNTPYYCTGNQIKLFNQLDAEINHWYVNGLLKSEKKEFDLHFAYTGNYSVKLIAIQANCTDTSYLELYCQSYPSLQLEESYSKCIHDEFSLSLPSYYDYIWEPQPNDIIPIVKAEGPILYQITAIHPEGGPCSTTKSFRFLPRMATARASYDSTISIKPGIPVYLQGCCGDKYEWSPATFLDNPFAEKPVCTPTKSIEYTLKVTDFNGCKASDKIHINVVDDFFIPELFSPNGDNVNDTFKVYGKEIETVKFSIYNKWGQLVFHTSSPDEIMNSGWDGTYKNELQPTGSYIWKIEGKFTSGDPITFKDSQTGTVFLMK
ncbi:MAG: gliding motility-associated C-terminal domain-containing protein [Cytophagaceae bacterium]